MVSILTPLSNKVNEFMSQSTTSKYLLAALGGLHLLKMSFPHAEELIRSFQRNNLSRIATEYGGGQHAWVLVTGATDALGRGYSEMFARFGFNLVLVARNEKKLALFSDYLKKSYPEVEIKTIIFDFGLLTSYEDYTRDLREGVKNLDLRIVVNNLGFIMKQRTHYSDLKTMNDIVNVNSYTLALVTNSLLQLMRGQGATMKGGVKKAFINMTTDSFRVENPIYTGSKDSDKTYAGELMKELAEENIDVINIHGDTSIFNVRVLSPVSPPHGYPK